MDEVRIPEKILSSPSGLFDRLRGAWRDVAEQFGIARSGIAPDLPPDDVETLRSQMRDCLEGRGGEVSARARAAVLGQSYLALNAEGRLRFLRILANEFGTDSDDVDAAIALVETASDQTQRLKAEQKLREALENPRVKLLTQFNALPDGIKFLVDLRGELMNHTKGDVALSALDADLRDLLSAWFDVGFLELRRITWRSPALVLEKIAGYEAVHAIESWRDLKNRLDSDRRFFAFFHPRMPDEPLIFVEVALVKGMSANVRDLLDETAPVGDPRRADSAIFYSITSTQKGLAGISFGNFLIKRVADALGHEFPNLKTFATLSPIPGFRAWLDGQIAAGDPLLPPERRELIQAGLSSVLAEALDQDWIDNPAWAEAMSEPLLRLCAVYLTSLRENTARALDPVAHFHLSNGARLERLNWLADPSEKGIAQSAGIMTNYQYRLADVEENHEAYTGQGKIIVSSAVRALTKK
ncbi:MAG TPA: malonyl-CoA decarboxylase [Magnetospirillaceae bacterium]|jgi:malonyl-CoA decarboxylase